MEIIKEQNQRENDIRKMSRITNQYLLMNTYQFLPIGAMAVKSIEVLNASRYHRAWVLAYQAIHQHLINRPKLVRQTSHGVMQAISYIIIECLMIRAKFTGRVRLVCIRREARQAPKWTSSTLATVNAIEERSVKPVIPVREALIVVADRAPLPKGKGQLASINGKEGKLEKVEAKLLPKCSGIQPGEIGRKFLVKLVDPTTQSPNNRRLQTLAPSGVELAALSLDL